MEVQKDFHTTIATCVNEADKTRAVAEMEEFRGKYKEITTKGLQMTGALFNTMEQERTEKAETGQPATAAAAGARTLWVDKALHPSFKAAFLLSMDKFRKWKESVTAWGQSSSHELRSQLVQKLHFEAICEKEFYVNCPELDTFQEMVEEATHVYNKRVSVFIRRSEFMNARREEGEAYLSYYHRL